MNKRTLPLLAVASCLLAHAQIADDADESQADLRINPEIADTYESDFIDLSAYPKLNLAANKIDMNGADWSELARRFANVSEADSLFSLVYLGDSHIQADFGGAVVRSRLAEASHQAGRGFITPFKLTGTNEPVDYTFRIDCSYVASRLLKMPWATDMTFSGVGITPTDREFTVDISCRTPFDRLTFHYTGAQPIVTTVVTEGDTIPFVSWFPGAGRIAVELMETVDEVAVSFATESQVTLAGANLAFADTGTFVHSIGNNGATYSTYGLIDGFGKGIAQLHPDLIVIALGTNEAFGKTTAEDILIDIDHLVNTIRRNNPRAELMLVTPSECFKRVYTSSKRRRRRTASKVVNTKVEQMRNAILSYGAKHNIPVYDTFAVAGQAADLEAAGILSKDGVHFTAQGYRVLGNLLADAILAALR